jgi:hypothetical protein
VRPPGVRSRRAPRSPWISGSRSDWPWPKQGRSRRMWCRSPTTSVAAAQSMTIAPCSVASATCTRRLSMLRCRVLISRLLAVSYSASNPVRLCFELLVCECTHLLNKGIVVIVAVATRLPFSHESVDLSCWVLASGVAAQARRKVSRKRHYFLRFQPSWWLRRAAHRERLPPIDGCND